jgi:hypothetical protein
MKKHKDGLWKDTDIGHFAGVAMQGILSNTEAWDRLDGKRNRRERCLLCASPSSRTG